MNFIELKDRRISGGAFTLVEVMVAFALAAVVTTGLWLIFSSNMRHGRRTSGKLDSLKGAISFVQRFEHDLNRLCIDSNCPLRIYSTGDKLIEFYVYDDRKSDFSRHILGADKVTYYFDRQKHAVFRQQGTDKKRRLRGYYENFLIQQGAADDPCISYMVTSVGADFFSKPESARKAFDRAVFQNVVVIKSAAASLLYPYWQEVPYTFDVD